jgi:hypothetical protein
MLDLQAHITFVYRSLGYDVPTGKRLGLLVLVAVGCMAIPSGYAHAQAMRRDTRVVRTQFVKTADTVDPSTLTGKLIMGYQGWFNCQATAPRSAGGTGSRELTRRWTICLMPPTIQWRSSALPPCLTLPEIR